MMVDLNNGSLPWFGQDSRDYTAQLKEYLLENEYMHACPLAFRSIMDYLRTLTYKQRPDYCGLESIFIQMLEAREITNNQPMDWEPAYIKRPEEAKKPAVVRKIKMVDSVVDLDKPTDGEKTQDSNTPQSGSG
uniref:RFC1 domain-containing protein n=1 Tax=Meloidogyne hapla TaxID=6305 RepID=A0A1I8B6K7_MELHA